MKSLMQLPVHIGHKQYTAVNMACEHAFIQVSLAYVSKKCGMGLTKQMFVASLWHLGPWASNVGIRKDDGPLIPAALIYA